MQHNEKHIARLISNHMRGKLTDQQQKELHEWLMTDDANVELFEDLIDEEKQHEARIWFKQRGAKWPSNYHEPVEVKGRNKTIIKIIAATAIAASIILFNYGIEYIQPDKEFAGEQLVADADKAMIAAKYQIGSLINAFSGKDSLSIPDRFKHRYILSNGCRAWLADWSSVNDSSGIFNFTGEGLFKISSINTPAIIRFGNTVVKSDSAIIIINTEGYNAVKRISVLKGSATVTEDQKTVPVISGQDIFINNKGKIHLNN